MHETWLANINQIGQSDVETCRGHQGHQAVIPEINLSP